MIRYDLYTASSISFSDVVHDRLSAETADADGEVLFEQVAWYDGVFLGLKVQAVDSNGDETSLTADVFKAVKSPQCSILTVNRQPI